MKLSHHEFLQREQGLPTLLEDADRNVFTNNFHIYALFCDFSSSYTGVNSSNGFYSKIC